MKYEDRIKPIYDWAKNEIKDILDFYIKYAYDPAGGFFGAVTRELVPQKNADRGLVLNGRLLWTFANAYGVLKDSQYLDISKHAKEYILKYFIDPVHGGAYWSVHADGTPSDEAKYPYGISFVIYGGAELARVSGDMEAAAMAREMYSALEEHAFDPINGGCFEAYSRDWSERLQGFNIKEPSLGSKALNTHLHLIESITNLTRVDPDPEIRKKTRSMIDIMTTKLLDLGRFHYKPYMTDDWQTTDYHVSYGHDIEASWLLTEAAAVYGDTELIEQCKPIAVRIASSCLEGLNPKTGGMYYEGDSSGSVDLEMSWWTQAEAVNGFFNAYLISGDDRYLKLTEDTLQYIKDYISDREGGVFREWLSRGDRSARDPSNEMRAGAWKGPYHNGRMCLKLIKLIEETRQR
ncbi:MAG: AGE family epimerase/isomerase [Clostridiales bacterium]|nr:AGE family epimerase/isomerase [Clostridiales bacterium]